MKTNSKTVATYVTSRGNVALEVTRHTGHDGNVTYSYDGKHGAGSGHGLEHVKSTVRVMLATHKGIKLSSGWDMLSEPAPSPSVVPASLDLTTPKAAFRYLNSIDSPTVEIAGFGDQLSPVDDAIRAITGESSSTFAMAHNCWMWSTPELLRVLAECDPTAPVVPVEVPAVPDLLHFLKAAHADLAATYKAIQAHGGPEVSIGQFLRLQDYETAIKFSQVSHAANLAKIQRMEETLLRIATNSDGMAKEAGPREAGMWTVCANDARAALALPSAPPSPLDATPSTTC